MKSARTSRHVSTRRPGVRVPELILDACAAASQLCIERLRAANRRTTRPETDPRPVGRQHFGGPSLLALLEYARQLDAAERRAVVALMRELTA